MGFRSETIDNVQKLENSKLSDMSHCCTAMPSGKNLETDGDSPFKTSHSGVSFDGQRKINKLSIHLVTVIILA